MRNIQEIRTEIKSWADEAIGQWGLVSIVFLVGLASFGLGRFSALEEVKPPVAIGEAATAAKPVSLALGGLVVASRVGNAYYYPWCTGAGKISPANQIWFTSESAAAQAGYHPAKGCAGLGQ